MKNPYFTQRRRTHTFVKAWTKKSLGRARTAHRPLPSGSTGHLFPIRPVDRQNPGSGLSYQSVAKSERRSGRTPSVNDATICVTLDDGDLGIFGAIPKNRGQPSNTQSYRPS